MRRKAGASRSRRGLVFRGAQALRVRVRRKAYHHQKLRQRRSQRSYLTPPAPPRFGYHRIKSKTAQRGCLEISLRRLKSVGLGEPGGGGGGGGLPLFTELPRRVLL